MEVKDGKVSLQGTVSERRMKHRIEDIVDDCMGVKDIDNRIRVTPAGQHFGSETTMSVGGSGSGSAQGAGSSSSSSGRSSK